MGGSSAIYLLSARLFYARLLFSRSYGGLLASDHKLTATNSAVALPGSASITLRIGIFTGMFGQSSESRNRSDAHYAKRNVICISGLQTTAAKTGGQTPAHYRAIAEC